MKLHACMKDCFPVILYLQGFFSFYHKLHQSPNGYNDHENGSGGGRPCPSGCTDHDESFGYGINDKSVSSNEDSNSTVRKYCSESAARKK